MKAKIAELEGMIGQAKPFDATHVKALVQPFSGDDLMDIHTWLEKLEDTFRVLKVGKTEQLIAACGLLTGTAEVFRRITTLKDYDDFRTKLVEEFRYNKLTDETIVKELRKHTLKDSNLPMPKSCRPNRLHKPDPTPGRQCCYSMLLLPQQNDGKMEA
uniref:Uncharacterized protein n=1 Tax=Anopheles melas TaxID=34690 RepID=A0A182UL50_9DIPT